MTGPDRVYSRGQSLTGFCVGAAGFFVEGFCAHGLGGEFGILHVECRLGDRDNRLLYYAILNRRALQYIEYAATHYIALCDITFSIV